METMHTDTAKQTKNMYCTIEQLNRNFQNQEFKDKIIDWGEMVDCNVKLIES